MLYTVEFYALPAQKVAERMMSGREKLLAQLQRWLKGKLRSDPDAIVAIRSAAEAICRREVPIEAPQPFFDALWALLKLVGEAIPLGGYRDFRHIAFLEEVGIWPWTQQESAPFPLPRTKHPPPEFGFLSNRLMQEVVLPGFKSLPPCRESSPLSKWCQRARNQFREAVESVAADGLDMICYFCVW